jgi:hypothetical protein
MQRVQLFVFQTLFQMRLVFIRSFIRRFRYASPFG